MNINIYVPNGTEFIGFSKGKAVEAVTETINGNLVNSIPFESGRVSLPVNEDGSIKWLDESLFTRKSQ
ncbi:hypothetical protein [Lacrimispora sp.]|uniref:hypothetical protein n=1 Tax=Lacrimispora sp. TaxID=2719234 RepID=UPI0028A7B915|nr:hypothetical protein [Lacrimispora sp.]